MNQNDADGLEEICRVCLETSSKMYPLIGPVLNVDINISEMITYCTSIELSLDDDLPKGVCIPCFRTIRIAYNFICQFRETNQKLLEGRELNRMTAENRAPQTYAFEEDEEKIIITCVSETLDDEISEELSPQIMIPQNEIIELDTVDLTSNETCNETAVPVSEIYHEPLRKKVVKNYVCPKCSKGFRSFDSGFVPHLLTHHKNELVKCSKCSVETVFITEMYIQHYKRIHLYQCHICLRSFGRKSSLYYHMKVHNASKPYECSFENCKKSFLTSWSLSKHLNTHSDATKYICSKCGSNFKTYDTFRYHQKTHDGNRNHLCPECGRAFLQAVHLKYHMWKHTGIKQFHCDKCSKSYTSVTQLKKHKRKYCGAVKADSAC